MRTHIATGHSATTVSMRET